MKKFILGGAALFLLSAFGLNSPLYAHMMVGFQGNITIKVENTVIKEHVMGNVFVS